MEGGEGRHEGDRGFSSAHCVGNDVEQDEKQSQFPMEGGRRNLVRVEMVNSVSTRGCSPRNH